MSTYIKELTDEASEIITNAHAAEEAGEITREQRIEIVQALLADVADRIEVEA
jgi:hypothetical protein